MIYITYDKSANEITIRPFKELKLKLTKVDEQIKELTLLDVDGEMKDINDKTNPILYALSSKIEINEILDLCRNIYIEGKEWHEYLEEHSRKELTKLIKENKRLRKQVEKLKKKVNK